MLLALLKQEVGQMHTKHRSATLFSSLALCRTDSQSCTVQNKPCLSCAPSSSAQAKVNIREGPHAYLPNNSSMGWSATVKCNCKSYRFHRHTRNQKAQTIYWVMFVENNKSYSRQRFADHAFTWWRNLPWPPKRCLLYRCCSLWVWLNELLDLYGSWCADDLYITLPQHSTQRGSPQSTWLIPVLCPLFRTTRWPRQRIALFLGPQ